MAKEFRNVKILEFGNIIDDIMIPKKSMHIPKRAIRIVRDWGTKIGKADNFKIKDNCLFCDAHLEETAPTMNLVPSLNTKDTYENNDDDYGTAVYTSITELLFFNKEDIESGDYVCKNNLRGKEIIINWKNRIMSKVN